MRYFFYFSSGSGLLSDESNRSFSTVDDVLSHAMGLADKLKAEGPSTLKRFVVVADETGEELARVLIANRHA